MDKKGWVKIVEASIAILIVVSTLFIVINSNRELEMRNNMPTLSERMLEDVATNNVMREKILAYDTDNPENSSNQNIINDLEAYISSRIGLDYDFKLTICQAEELCFINLGDISKRKEVYSNERVISSTLTNFGNPKKIKIYLWII